MRYDGQVAWITGASSGIGAALAQAFAAAGAEVILSGRREDALRAVAATLPTASLALPFETTDMSALPDAVARAESWRGRVDLLVNNAGISHRKAPQDYTMAEWNDVLSTNLTAAFVCAQAAYPHFITAGGGKIINTGSLMSVFGSTFAAAYGASKGGLLQLGKSLACAWGRDNIQVNAILPGWIDTDLSRSARSVFPGLEERVLQRTPAARWGTPQDFAGLAVFLAGPASDFITGAAIAVDGGYSALG